jgi:transposase-like protein
VKPGAGAQMMILFKGVKDATIKLKCPHCGYVQLRAKKKEKHPGYACKKCHKRWKL